jgi:hypothetical protein
MIKVFGGEWRGLGKKEKHQGMILEFEFRKYLKEFKGARLTVFMCIALHCDENGECFPSYDLIEAETGLTRGTIGAAINDLCELVIEGHRVLHRFRERDEAGKYIGSNHYLVFPTDEEIQSIEIRTVDNHSIKKPQSEKSNGGEIIPEVNPSVKDKPPIKGKQDSGAEAPSAPKESKKRERDTRLDHPAILLVRGVTKAYPPKAAFSFVIDKLGATPDGPKFATAYQTWCTRGNKPTNLEGIIDWYINGVPPQYKPSYGKAGTPAPANPPEVDYTDEREAIKKAAIAKRLAAREGQNANAQASPR